MFNNSSLSPAWTIICCKMLCLITQTGLMTNHSCHRRLSSDAAGTTHLFIRSMCNLSDFKPQPPFWRNFLNFPQYRSIPSFDSASFFILSFWLQQSWKDQSLWTDYLHEHLRIHLVLGNQISAICLIPDKFTPQSCQTDSSAKTCH